METGFAPAYVPFFVVVGFDKVVYWDSNSYMDGDLVGAEDFRTAVNRAIDEFPTEAVYVYEELTNRSYKVGDSEDIDISNVFGDLSGNSVTVTIENNTNPSMISASIDGNTLTVNALTSTDGVALTLKGVSTGELSATTDFNITVYDPIDFDTLNVGFESGSFALENWVVKYNTAADGGLNGANLLNPPTGNTWLNNTSSTPDLGSDYIHTGGYSAAVVYFSPDFNWLISPEMQLDYDDYVLKFWLWFKSSDYPSKFNVLVDDGTKGWTTILAYDGSTSDNLFDSEIDVHLGAFVNQTIRIAFVTEYSDGNHVAIDDINIWSRTVGIQEAFVPASTILKQNYPNPFNPSTEINFTLENKSNAQLVVLNSKGEVVETLNNGKLDKGFHSFVFDAKDLNSGVYFYQLKVDGVSSTKKMLLVK